MCHVAAWLRARPGPARRSLEHSARALPGGCPLYSTASRPPALLATARTHHGMAAAVRYSATAGPHRVRRNAMTPLPDLPVTRLFVAPTHLVLPHMTHAEKRLAISPALGIARSLKCQLMAEPTRACQRDSHGIESIAAPIIHVTSHTSLRPPIDTLQQDKPHAPTPHSHHRRSQDAPQWLGSMVLLARAPIYRTRIHKGRACNSRSELYYSRGKLVYSQATTRPEVRSLSLWSCHWAGGQLHSARGQHLTT